MWVRDFILRVLYLDFFFFFLAMTLLQVPRCHLFFFLCLGGLRGSFIDSWTIKDRYQGGSLISRHNSKSVYYLSYHSLVLFSSRFLYISMLAY